MAWKHKEIMEMDYLPTCKCVWEEDETGKFIWCGLIKWAAIDIEPTFFTTNRC